MGDALDQTQRELRELRMEVGEVRDLAEAVLTALVGKEGINDRIAAAGVAEMTRREDRGLPLSQVFSGDALDAFTWPRRGLGVLTVEELVKLCPREEVAAMRGVGPAKMAELDAVVADRGLRWAESG